MAEVLRQRPVLDDDAHRMPSKHSREWIRKPGKRQGIVQA